jgi:hypothetical protein
VIENAQERLPEYWKDLKVSIVGANQAYFFNPREVGRTKSPGYTPPYADASSNNAPFFDPSNSAFPVTYKAYNKHLTDEILVEDEIVNYGNPGIDSVFIADVSTMRMIAGDEDLAIRVEWDGPGKADDLKLLNIDKTGTPSNDGLIVREFKNYYQTAYYRNPSSAEIQYELDSHFEWIIFLRLPSNLGDTHMTAQLYIHDWTVIDSGDDAGGSDVKF